MQLTGGAQSSLLLTDKLILFAVITLNDGAGNILRRRLLTFSPASTGSIAIHEDREMTSCSPKASGRALLQQPSGGEVAPIQSDEEIFATALHKITQEPRVGTLPPIQYNVDIPLTAATIFGVQHRIYSLVQLDVVGRFSDVREDSMQTVGDEFYRRLSANLTKFCPSCEKVFPVFNNIVPTASSSGRRLLQAPQTVAGTYTILLVFDGNATGIPIYYTDISRVVYSSSYTSLWTGTGDQASIQALVDSLKGQQFAVRRVDTSGTAQ